MPTPPKSNLLAHEIEDVAEHIKRQMQRGSLYAVYVADDGAVRIHNLDHTRDDARPLHEMVGTYRRNIRIEQLEDDLIARLRELTTPCRDAA